MKTRAKMIPDGDPAKQAMLHNFAVKLPNYAKKYGIGDDEVADIVSADIAFTYSLAILGQLGTYATSWTSVKNLLRDGPDAGDVIVFPANFSLGTVPAGVDGGVFSRVSGIAARIKNHPAYAEADGLDLGIVGAAQTFDPSTGKPVITAEVLANGVNLGWPKGNFTGIRFEVDHGDGKGHVFLAIDTIPDYLDTTPFPPAGTSAVWKYRAIYIYNDMMVGQWSDEVKVTVAA